MSKTDTLDKIYKDPSYPAGFTSQEKLLQSARLLREDISLGDVKEYLSRQSSFTRHGNVPKKFIMRRVFIKEGPGFLLSADLADMTTRLKKANDGVRFLMFLIDCYSRKLWVFPLTNKSGPTIAESLDKFLTSNKYRYDLFWVDDGKEWYNSATQKICEKHGLKMYSTFNRREKACYAERAIRTIKAKLFRIMTERNSHRYIDFLQDVVDAYNKSQHRGLLCNRPNEIHEVSDKDEILAFAKKQYAQKLSNYGSAAIKRPNSKINFSQRDILEPNTYVRLLLNSSEGTFAKSYKAIYTEEIFIIDSVKKITPTLYTLKDFLQEPISGIVYRNELKVTSLPEKYLIESILQTKTCPKTKKKIYLVKYLGWPIKFAFWVSDLIKI